jgi:hypothetical protein
LNVESRLQVEKYSSHPWVVFLFPFFHFCSCIKTSKRLFRNLFVQIWEKFWKTYYEVFIQSNKNLENAFQNIYLKAKKGKSGVLKKHGVIYLMGCKRNMG